MRPSCVYLNGNITTHPSQLHRVRGLNKEQTIRSTMTGRQRKAFSTNCLDPRQTE